jgi:hypothetical protein
MGISVFKGIAARRLYKSFGVKGLIMPYDNFRSDLHDTNDYKPCRIRVATHLWKNTDTRS